MIKYIFIIFFIIINIFEIKKYLKIDYSFEKFNYLLIIFIY